MIYIIIAEENSIGNEIQKKLRSSSKLFVTAVATDAGQLIKLVTTPKKPDVLLISDSLPDVEETIKKIRMNYPDVKVLLLTFRYSEHFIDFFLRSDAQGCELKEASKEKLVEAIENIFNIGAHLRPEVSQMILNHARSARELRVELTNKEKEILNVIGEGMGRAELKKFFNISMNTVDGHLKNLFSKFDVHSIRELEHKARKLGYIK